MEESSKQLLLKDLCARIPYNVVGKCEIDASYDTSFDTVFQTHKFNAEVYGIKEDLLLVTPLIEDNDDQTYAEEEVADGVSILDFTPYLFPLSSMTEEQEDKWYEVFVDPLSKKLDRHTRQEGLQLQADAQAFGIEYLLKNHFDIYGLIPMGLALDATGLNIY